MNSLKVVYDTTTLESIPIDLDEIIKGRALFQANSGGGKSYLLRKFLEESNGKVQQIIIDPEGEFSTLREKYDYLLVGKDNADIQIDARHAPLLAKKLMETGNNAILDLYEMSSFERIRYVKVFVDALVNLPKNLWHPCLIVIDEIHTFAPESSKGRSESLESVASLASRGRKRGYALIGATQKLSKFHKDVAAELNTKFTGRCTLDIDQKRAAQELGIKEHTILRNLDHEFFVFGPGIDGTIKVKSYPVKTTHEDIGSTVSTKLGNPNKIKTMMKDFAELPQEAENELKTTQDLNRKILEQKQEIDTLSRQQPKQDPQALQKSYERGYAEAIKKSKQQFNNFEISLKRYLATFQPVFQEVVKLAQDIEKVKVVNEEIQKVISTPLDLKLPTIPEIITTKLVTKEAQASVRLDHGELQTISDPNELPLGRCEKSILETLAKFNKPCSRVKVGIFSNYSAKSGGFSNAISKLKNLGFLNAQNGDLEITDSGAQQVLFVKPFPSTNEEVLAFWVNKVGKCPGAILQAIVPIYPNSMSKEDAGIQTNYSANSGGFSNAISKLRTLGLIDYSNGQIKATEDMFP